LTAADIRHHRDTFPEGAAAAEAACRLVFAIRDGVEIPVT
jgi:hypothetical protein